VDIGPSFGRFELVWLGDEDFLRRLMKFYFRWLGRAAGITEFARSGILTITAIAGPGKFYISK
jgi:hypothetical protein